MSMRVQGALANCCDGIKSAFSTVASTVGKAITATGNFIAESARKVAEFVKPHFENLKTFAQENKESILIAAIAAAAGMLFALFCSKVCCGDDAPRTPAPLPPAVPVSS